jgi:inhibitor of KinA
MIKCGMFVPNSGIGGLDMGGRQQNRTIEPLSDTSIIVTFGREINSSIHNEVQAFNHYLDQFPFKGFIEYVSAFTSVTIFYDPIIVRENRGDAEFRSAYEIVHSYVEHGLNQMERDVVQKTREIEIPVFYGGEYGEDLEVVARHNNLTTDEVINIHSKGDYLVYMIGFAPGFPYLGGMSKEIVTPRRSNPRTSIPRGSVGIAGEQTGVYSLDTPGGWQIIGRTPLELFCPNDNPPTLLQPGDKIRFKPITLAEYNEYKEKIT